VGSQHAFPLFDRCSREEAEPAPQIIEALPGSPDNRRVEGHAAVRKNFGQHSLREIADFQLLDQFSQLFVIGGLNGRQGGRTVGQEKEATEEKRDNP